MLEKLSSLPPTATVDRVIDPMFGGRVPTLAPVQARCMHRLERSDCALENWQIRPEGFATAWTLTVHWPHSGTPCPVLLSPDACWPHVTSDEAVHTVLKEGVALAWFNRTELAFDPPDAQRRGPVFEQWPQLNVGALSAWAWGLQRCVDVLLALVQTDARRLGVIGHSRGGKAALLAAASDVRITAVVSHNSGTAGAASLQRSGAGAESLADLAARFPHWLGSACQNAAVQNELIALDASTELMSHLAPRGLCLLQAQGDAWANPEGTRHAFEQLRPHWQAQRAAHRLVLHERGGGHAMGTVDWQRAAHFLRELR